jgi:hypothetical protein
MLRVVAVAVLLVAACDRGAKQSPQERPSDNRRISLEGGRFDLTWATRDCASDNDCVLTETRTCDCYCPETAVNTAAAARIAELSDTIKCPPEGESSRSCLCESLTARCDDGRCRAVTASRM